MSATQPPHITSHSDHTFNHANPSVKVINLPLVHARNAAMSDGQKFQYRSLTEAMYDTSSSDFDPTVLELGPTSYSGSAKNTPTSASLLATLRIPSTYSDHDRPSKIPESPPFYPAPAKARSIRGKHPFANGFEVPHWKQILLHTALCLVSYPILLAVTLIARNKSIFWTRFIVGVGCGFVGLYLGYSLLTLAKCHLEAASEL
ncbi:hypothetical protein DXG01_011754 [Tephrocybe rancida]|nr:hypothetical protein DXG01_011754 [Tephrocybe rancida]